MFSRGTANIYFVFSLFQSLGLLGERAIAVEEKNIGCGSGASTGNSTNMEGIDSNRFPLGNMNGKHFSLLETR